MRAFVASAVLTAIGVTAHAQPSPDDEPQQSAAPEIQLHGFVSEGGFVTTANEFIGHSTRGSLELFEAALNVTAQLDDKLRAGVQLFAQDQGTTDVAPRVDWAFLDYAWRPWLGVRAGRVRIPFGLYNDYIDIDAGRVPLLPPQSVYSIGDRNTLTAQNGFAVYGTVPVTCWGDIEYTAYGGVLTFPIPSAQDPTTPVAFRSDSRYVAGASVFWRTPIEDLRVGGSVLRGALALDFHLPQAQTDQLIAAGAATADFDGNVRLSLDPANLFIGSVEYVRGDLTFAAEYSRWFLHYRTTPVPILPVDYNDNERFYGLVTYRATPKVAAAVSYSVLNTDANDRSGKNPMLPEPFYAWSRDAAATLRFDVNDYWLWKLEGHFIDGGAAADRTLDPTLKRYWGLFLVRTTVTF